MIKNLPWPFAITLMLTLVSCSTSGNKNVDNENKHSTSFKGNQRLHAFLDRYGLEQKTLIEVKNNYIYVNHEKSTPLDDDWSVPAEFKYNNKKSLKIETLSRALEEASKEQEVGASGRYEIVLYLQRNTLYSVLNDIIYTSLWAFPVEDETGKVRRLNIDIHYIFENKEDASFDLFTSTSPTSYIKGFEYLIQQDRPRVVTIKNFVPNIVIDSNGIRFFQGPHLVKPVAGCPKGGPTICLKDGESVRELLDLLKKTKEKDKRASIVNKIEALYDWRSLYNVMIFFKAKQPDQYKINVVMENDMPAEMIHHVLKTSTFVRSSDDKYGFFRDDATFDAETPEYTSVNSSYDRTHLYPDVRFIPPLPESL